MSRDVKTGRFVLKNPSKPLTKSHPYLAKLWHPNKNGNLKPEQVTRETKIEAWLLCINKFHKPYEWKISFPLDAQQYHNRTKYKYGCKKCAPKNQGQRRTITSIKKHGSIVDYPHMMKLWDSKKNKVNPKNIASGSHTRRFWICSKDHHWSAPPQSIKKGTGCNICARPQTSKGELRIFSELVYIFGSIINLHERKRTGGREADIFFDYYNLAIEYDGDYRHGWKKTIASDKRKNKKFQELNITLIRVRITRLPKISKHEVKFKDGENHKLVINRLISKINSCVKLDKVHKSKIRDYLNKDNFVNNDHYEDMMAKYPYSPPKGQSFGDKAPKDVVDEWDWKKNKRTPFDFLPQAHDKAWFICKNGHSYDQRIQGRYLGNACGYCPSPGGTQRVLPSVNSFGAVYPQLVHLFHKTKNRMITSYDFTPGSSIHRWWKCTDCTEEWMTSPKTIIRSYKKTNGKAHGCPYCAGQAVGKYNNLQIRYPRIAKEFDSKKNGLTSKKIMPGDVRKYWWKCKWCGENYHKSPNTLITQFKNTSKNQKFIHPKCKKSALFFKKDLKSRYPEVAKEFDSKRNGITPNEVTYGTTDLYWWKCRRCGESYKKSVCEMTSKFRRHQTIHPFCKKSLFLRNKDLKSRYPEVAKEFDSKRNGITPDEISVGTYDLYWWKCRRCGESYKKSGHYMTHDRKKFKILHPRCKYIKKK